MNDARRLLFSCNDTVDLSEIITLPENLGTGIYKCRIIYDYAIHDISFTPYKKRDIRSLKIVHDDNIDYSYKYENRSAIEKLFEQRDNCDDIIIVKNNLLTDSSFANLALFNGSKWITPKQPLLKGTKRQFLLDNGLLTEADILSSDIRNFHRISLINAMLDLDEVSVYIN